MKCNAMPPCSSWPPPFRTIWTGWLCVGLAAPPLGETSSGARPRIGESRTGRSRGAVETQSLEYRLAGQPRVEPVRLGRTSYTCSLLNFLTFGLMKRRGLKMTVLRVLTRYRSLQSLTPRPSFLYCFCSSFKILCLLKNCCSSSLQ